MSSPPRSDRRPITLTKLAEMRALGEPIVMVTAYDHPSAIVAEEAGVDIVLVGDSAANNVLGYEDTVPVTVEELLMLAAAVRRGLRTPLLVGDLPFGSYEASDAQAIATAHRFVNGGSVAGGRCPPYVVAARRPGVGASSMQGAGRRFLSGRGIDRERHIAGRHRNHPPAGIRRLD